MADLCQQSAALSIFVLHWKLQSTSPVIQSWMGNGHWLKLFLPLFSCNTQTFWAKVNQYRIREGETSLLAAAKLSGVVKWLLWILSSPHRHQLLCSDHGQSGAETIGFIGIAAVLEIILTFMKLLDVSVAQKEERVCCDNRIPANYFGCHKPFQTLPPWRFSHI